MLFGLMAWWVGHASGHRRTNYVNTVCKTVLTHGPVAQWRPLESGPDPKAILQADGHDFVDFFLVICSWINLIPYMRGVVKVWWQLLGEYYCGLDEKLDVHKVRIAV